MSQYRTIGIQCDGNDQRCEEQVELTGGAIYPAVYSEARKQGWHAASIAGPHLCPQHRGEK